MKWPPLKTTWPFIPIVLGILATFLFLFQGGFAGGHGRFDGLIVALMLPSIAIIEVVPLPESIIQFDYMLVIAIPTFVNLGLLTLIDRLVVRKRRVRGY